VVAPRFDLVVTRREPGPVPSPRTRAKFSAVEAKPPPRLATTEHRPASGPASPTAVSSFQVLLSAAAFAAAASGVAMWFVH
jgi:hypothetical protein